MSCAAGLLLTCAQPVPLGRVSAESTGPSSLGHHPGPSLIPVLQFLPLQPETLANPTTYVLSVMSSLYPLSENILSDIKFLNIHFL